MIKNNKWQLMLSSLVILLPVLAGLVLWDDLPFQMTTHWGVDGNADGWGGRSFAVFGLPLIILALHWLCVFFTAKDPKNKNQNKKVFGMVLWICPVISLFAYGIVFAAAFGKEINLGVWTMLLIGLMFVILGNYLPKCRQNYTIGIKIKWTLTNEENWNATHRFSGKVYVFGGLLMMLCVFLPGGLMVSCLLIGIIAMVVLPFLYSYCYYRKQLKAGTATIGTALPVSKKQKVIGIVFTAVIIVFVCVMMFTGNIEVKYGDSSFTIEADYWEDLTVSYDAIDEIEYRDASVSALRVGGFGSARLLMGNFENDEFGHFTRYTYTRCNASVILTCGEDILVVSGKDEERTRAIYEELKEKCSNGM